MRETGRAARTVICRPFRDDDPIPEITALLHAAYARLLRMGLNYTAADQDDTTTRQRLKRGWALVAECEGRIVGTITYYQPNPGSKAEFLRTAAYFGQFGVHPDYQGRAIGLRLLREVEARALAEGKAVLALDTAEGAEELRAWYASLGYNLVGHAQWEGKTYRSVILAKTLRS